MLIPLAFGALGLMGLASLENSSDNSSAKRRGIAPGTHPVRARASASSRPKIHPSDPFDDDYDDDYDDDDDEDFGFDEGSEGSLVEYGSDAFWAGYESVD